MIADGLVLPDYGSDGNSWMALCQTVPKTEGVVCN